ncbi:MAG: hypothetical protein H6Q66_2437 [Firmicutes bacterium]|nr:hypothetical protein [Bacillota bacterium]
MNDEKTTSCCPGQNIGSDNQTTCCCAGQEPAKKQKILIEFMYIDLTTCDRCVGTDSSLEEAIVEASALLKSTGREIEVRKILVENEKQAQELGFISSPTIRMDGQDIQLEFKESLCGCCGEIVGEDIDCRVWVWQGKEYTTPPKAMLLDAILRHVYGQPQGVNKVAAAKQVPENLKRFFAAKNKQK